MRKIISRYILLEITVPFFIILFLLTFVLLMGRIFQITELIMNKGISAWSILNLIAHLMPNFLLFTLPIALLISVLIAMGRFSADNEIAALKASGVSLLQIYYPVALVSLMAFLMTVVIGYYLVPHSNYATKKLLFELAQQNATIGIREKAFNTNFRGLLFYADKIPASGEYMEGVLVADRRLTGEPSTILANKAYIVADPRSMIVKLRLTDGSIHTVSPDLLNYRKIDFKIYDIHLDLSYALASISEEAKSSTEMTMVELLEKVRTPDLDPATRREFAIEAHKKFSIPFSCIFFGLLAVPMGIRNHRAVKSRGFALGIIIVSAYYLLRIGGEALVETGYLAPALGVWAPNVFFTLLGIGMLIITHKEISLSRIKHFLPSPVNLNHP
ncbi:MAG: LPS export ABC transporter permease LptF [Smithellaceae bacterium]